MYIWKLSKLIVVQLRWLSHSVRRLSVNFCISDFSETTADFKITRQEVTTQGPLLSFSFTAISLFILFSSLWSAISLCHKLILSHRARQFYYSVRRGTVRVQRLKLTWKVINHWKRQPYFFLRTYFLNRVLARCMLWLISWADGLTRAARSENLELQNEK